MIKRSLILGMIILILFSTAFAVSEYVKTKIIFNVESNPEFIVQVNNNTLQNTTSGITYPPLDGEATIPLTFVSETGDSPDCEYAHTDYATNPTFRFYNTGNEDLSFTMKYDALSPAPTGTITLYYDTDSSCGGGTALTTSWSIEVFPLAYGAAPYDIWLYAVFTGCPSSDSTETWLYTNATVTS